MLAVAGLLIVDMLAVVEARTALVVVAAEVLLLVAAEVVAVVVLVAVLFVHPCC